MAMDRLTIQNPYIIQQIVKEWHYSLSTLTAWYQKKGLESMERSRLKVRKVKLQEQGGGVGPRS